MTRYFNDSPIEKVEDDRYGVTPFAKSLAGSIRSIKAPVGAVIALHGAWGSGKSSAVNIVRHALESGDDEALVISDFKCWWYRGEEALTLAFLQNLNALLTDTLQDKVKGLVPQLGKCLLQAGPAIGSALALTPARPFAALAGAGLTFAHRFFPKGDTLEKTFQKLVKVLKEEKRHFLIIVDDIDRLTPEEALAVFRLVKSVGCLPNVIYLLVFDRVLADRTVAERYPTEGPHFLEKIIQASFELPMPLRTDLNHAVLSAIEETCGSPDEAHLNRFSNVFHDVVAPYLTTPRHATRFQNAISMTWPAIVGEISIADFIALETLRLYEPSLFQGIRFSKSKLCVSCGQRDQNLRDETRFDPYLTEVKEEFHPTARLALQRLFPQMETSFYSPDFHAQWDAERRVCIEAHFDTYFRLSLSEDKLPTERINEFIAKADDRDFVQTAFRKAAALRRKSGTSMVPVILDELNTHAPRVAREKIEPLLSALFEIHDEIDLPIDEEREIIAFGNTTRRYHWLIRRLTYQRFTLLERTDLYLSALQQASLGWLVDFVDFAKGDYRERENGPQREEDCLTHEDAIDGLIEDALEAIRSSAREGSLLNHQDLIYILYRWRDFLGNDPSEVRAWTNPLLENDEALVVFARALTGETWSQGMGFVGLGDRVPERGTRAQISESTDILDVDAFRGRLETLQGAGTLDEEGQKTVDDFLEAWRRRREGRGDW